MMFGYRAKLGIIIPAPGLVIEPELSSVIPEGVTICTTRIPLTQTTPQGLIEMLDYAREAGKLLSQARVDVLGLLCTSGTLVKGAGFDKELSTGLKEYTGIKTVVTSTSVTEALRVLQAKRIVVATPYSEEINHLEKAFLEANGFQVLAIKGMGITEPYRMGLVNPGDTYRLARTLWRSDADALFISCTGIATFSIIKELEEDIGKPVITSNQASLWHMLQAVGVHAHIPELGTVFHAPPASVERQF